MGMPDIGLAGWFRQRALRTPTRTALSFEGQDWTYAQMQARVEAMAARLQALGVGRGDRVAFLGLNQPDFLFLLFACARLGAIFVPLNFRLSGPEIAAIVADAGADVLIADAQHRPVVDAVRGELGAIKHFMSEAGGQGWAPLAAQDLPVPAAVSVAPDDVAVLMYTSGTTGRPKGVMLTHGNFWWNNANAMHSVDVLSTDVTLVAAPLFHIGGLNVLTLITFQKGGQVVLHRGFVPDLAVGDITRYRVSTMFGVPAMFQAIARHPDFGSTDLSSLRLLICGGAPCPEPLLRIWEGRGVPVQQGYGLTETAPMVSFLPPEYALSKIGSSGLPPLFTEIRLIGMDGQIVTEAQVPGEILTRGPNIMAGYWNNPDATAAVIDAEGWFHTGDIGWMDAAGFLTISDRLKDMIITGGENVYPAEVESVLHEHPAVAEAAVIGVPDEQWGESVCAIVAVLPGQSLEIEGLRAFLTERLARYKLPRRLELVTALPRNATGKILKHELRRQFHAKAG